MKLVITIVADTDADGLIRAMVERTEGTGRVIVLGTPLDARAGDFPLQPAYVPFVRRLVLSSCPLVDADFRRAREGDFTVDSDLSPEGLRAGRAAWSPIPARWPRIAASRGR